MRPLLTGVVCGAILLASVAWAQTTLNGSSFALKTTGTTSGSAYTLTENGYVGTYITLAAPGSVTLTINASGVAAGGSMPLMNIVVNDSKTGWNVGTSAGNYTTGLSLPAGTHFIRTELANSYYQSGRTLQVNNLTLSGATLANTNSNANALAAADTYIANYRRGAATIQLTGPGNISLLPGTQVSVDLVRHNFDFGTAVAGYNGSTYLQSNPTPGSTNYNYQQALNAHFNCLVPENAGKWGSNSSGSVPTYTYNISYMNTILDYAQARQMRARMHNLIWGSQQPTWVNNMLNNSGSYSSLRNYITHRIGYYVGVAGDGNPNNDPARKYLELDVYNESYHTGAQNNTAYWKAYGASGVAGIYNEVATAATSLGVPLKLYVNEYNVIQDSYDYYSAWYRRHTETLLAAGAQINGIGVQSYPNTTGIGTNNDQHNAARTFAVLQNLSVLGRDICLTEFGAKSGTGEGTSALILNEQMRLMFGTPQATGFMMWGFWQGDIYRGDAAFYATDWTPRQPLTTWQTLMSQWDTNLTAVVNPDGSISFTGFYGDYNIGSQSLYSNLNLTKGTSQYSLQLATPPGWYFWNVNNSGSFSVSGNWTNGVPGGIGHTAHFGSSVLARSVTVDAPVTLGMINFDSPGTYTVGGSSTITLDGPAGIAAINLAAGNHTISAPLVLNDDLRVTVAPPAGVLNLSGNVTAAGRTITKAGPGTLQMNHLRAAGLNLAAGTLRLSAKSQANDPTGTSVLSNLSIAVGASLDLTNNAMVIDYIGAVGTLVGDVRQHLQTGRITSSVADSSKRHGYADNALLGRATFAGQSVDATSLLIKYTWTGDCNLDGQVDITDLGMLATSWQASGTWTNGDLDYSGFVDITDLGMLATNWQAGVGDPIPGGPSLGQGLATLGLPGAAIPEPAAALATIAAGLCLCGRPARRRPACQTDRTRPR